MQAYSEPGTLPDAVADGRAARKETTMCEAVQKSDIPIYMAGDSARIDLPNGWTAEIRVEYDEFMGAPWEEHDGHGPVSDWRSVDRYHDKRAGERELHRDHGSARYYDFAGAVALARKDGWGCPHIEKMADFATFGGHASKGELAACAAEQDFNLMRAWCNDEWHWISVMVTVRDAEGEEVECNSLGGIEDYTDYWRECAAEMINGIIGGVLIPACAAG